MSVSSTKIEYEVNLSVPQEKIESYLNFLNDFVKEILQLPEFSEADVFRYDELQFTNQINPSNHALVAVRYSVNSQKGLDEFLEKHQQAVSKKGTEFQFNVVSRRVLRCQFKQVKQSTNFGYVF